MGGFARWRGALAVSTLVAAFAGTSLATTPTASAAATPTCGFTNLPTTCGYIVTVNADGSATTSTGSGATFDVSDDVTVGVVNNSGGVLNSVALTGAGAFNFDSDGPCTKPPTSACQGPTTYEGPGVSFSGYSSANGFSTGTVNFTGGLAPLASAYFALENPPSSASAAAIAPSIAPASIAAIAGRTFSGVIATFTDLVSYSPSSFTAAITWGDGTPDTAGSVSESSPGSFSVSGTHTYSLESGATSPYLAYLVITDNANPPNSAKSPTISVTAQHAPFTASAVVVAPFATHKAQTITVATFKEANTVPPTSDFSARIDWGDGSSTRATRIALHDGVFSVKGRHRYSSHGTVAHPVTVRITDSGGSTEHITDNRVAVGDVVAACAAGICRRDFSAGGVAVQEVTANSHKGDLLISTDPNAGSTALDCDDPYRHAPSIVTGADTFTAGSSLVTSTDVFNELRAKGRAGSQNEPFAVCFQAATPFRDARGATVHLGILPSCPTARAPSGPCVKSIVTQDLDEPNEAADHDDVGGIDSDVMVIETVIYPAGDPRYG